MDLSVIIPTYNQAALLRECLGSLERQSVPADIYEIVVVDDGSTDQTQAVVSSAGERVRGVRLSANRGRSAARNAGVEHARAKLVIFVDSDVVVRPDFLASHLDAHRRHGPGILSRGPVVLVPDAQFAATAPVPRVAASPAYLDTANAGLERAAVLRAGMFDEGFPGYGWEDFELGIRLKHLGIRRVFCPQAVAFHIHPPMNGNALSDLLRKEEARARSAVYFYRKVPTLETRLLIQATLFHRVLFWLMSAGGLLTVENVPRLADRLRTSRLSPLAFLAVRGVLNRHYVRSLDREFRRHAPAAA